MITAAQLATLSDNITDLYLRMLGQAAGTYGLGNAADSDRSRSAWDDLEATVLSTGDVSFISQVGQALSSARSLTTADAVIAGAVGELYRRVSAVLRSYQVPNALTFEDYVLYLNTGGVTKWQCLLHPVMRDVLAAVQPSAELSPALFYKASTLATRPAAGAFTAGTDIDGADYAGGFLKVVATGVGATIAITAAGTGWNPATNAAEAMTWTANITVDATVVMTPSVTDALALTLTGVTGGQDTEALSFLADKPTGRPDLP